MSLGSTARRHTPATRWILLGEALTARNIWLLVAAFEVVLTLLSPLPGDVSRPLLNLAGGLVSSTAMLLIIMLGWAVLLRRLSGPARVAVAVPLIILAGVVRGASLQWLLVDWGMSQPGGQGYQYRVFVSVLVVVTGSFLGAVVKIKVEGHRFRLEQLEAAQEQLTMVLAGAESKLRSDQSDSIAAISTYLTEQLAGVRGVSPVTAINSLEYIAAEMVRPLSHELAATAPSWQPPESSSVKRRLDWSSVWGAMASPASINPLAPAIVILLVTPSSVFHMGVWEGIRLHAIVAGLIYLGLSLLRKAAPEVAQGRSTLVRLAVTSVLMVVACAPAAVAAWWLSDSDSGTINALYVLVVMPLVAMMFSFIRAARMRQSMIDTSVSEILRQTKWWVTRTRMAQWWHDGTLARALHGPVQSVIHVAAARLRAAVASGTAESDLLQSALDDVSQTLSDVVMAGQDSGDVLAKLDDLVATWHPLVAIETAVDETTAAVVNSDPVCADIALDVIAEAVSNAVRHGGARSVQVSVEVACDDEVSIEIADDGDGWKPASGGGELRPGLGTSQLDTCSLAWLYTATDGGNQLWVDLPLLRSSRSRTADPVAT